MSNPRRQEARPIQSAEDRRHDAQRTIETTERDNTQLRNEMQAKRPTNIKRVTKREIWDESSEDMKNLITYFCKTFNAKPLYIRVGKRGWKNDT